MINEEKLNFTLNNDEIEKAYLYIANDFYKKDNCIIAQNKIAELQKESTIQLLKVLFFLISTDTNDYNYNSLASYFNLLPKNLIKTCPNILDTKTSFDVQLFLINNPSFNHITTNHVEEIGNIYDILQTFRLCDKNNKLALLKSSESKKSAGSFYTPIRIVDFIVKNTLGRYIDNIIEKVNQSKNKNIKISKDDLINRITKVRILDPSCGGGIFLIRAIKYFIKRMSNILSNPDNSYLNKLADKFINDCIFGIDIDTIAVEVTIISLFLMSSKSNNHEYIENIKCDNALKYISLSEFNSSKFVGDSSLKTQFYDGFDLIISNPPYQFGENIPNSNRKIVKNFKYAVGQYDIYWLFYELAFRILLRNDGYHGYIIPDSILTRDDSAIVREKLLNFSILDIWHIGAVFNLPNVSSVVLIFQKRKPKLMHNINVFDKFNSKWVNNQQNYSHYNKNCFLIYLRNEQYVQIIKRMQKNYKTLGDIAYVNRGEELGKKSLSSNPVTKIGILSGQQIKPYKICKPELYLSDSNQVKKKNIYIGYKLLIRKTGAELIAATDENEIIFLQSVYSLKLKQNIQDFTPFDVFKVLLGILNSRLIGFYIHHTFTAYKLIYPQLNQSTILGIPIPTNFLKTDWTILINAVNNRSSCNDQYVSNYQAEIDSIVNSAYKLSKKECILINEHQTSLSFKR